MEIDRFISASGGQPRVNQVEVLMSSQVALKRGQDFGNNLYEYLCIKGSFIDYYIILQM